MRTTDSVNRELLKLFNCNASDLASHREGVLSERQIKAITSSSSDFKGILLALALSVFAFTVFVVGYQTSPHNSSSPSRLLSSSSEVLEVPYQKTLGPGELPPSDVDFGTSLLGWMVILILCLPFIIAMTGIWMYLRPHIVGTRVDSARGVIKLIREDDPDLGELFYLKVTNRTLSIERDVFSYIESHAWNHLIAIVYYLPSTLRVVSLEIVEAIGSSKVPDVIHL